MKDGFTFLLLDHLSTVKGYNKKAKSGIYANEVRDTREEVFVVKFFDGDTIATGTWQSIKEKVSYAKGKFAASCYIAYKDGDELKIGNIMFSGCSLGPWFDFYKNNRKEVDAQSVVIHAGKKDTSGSVDFVPPKFSIKKISEDTDAKAKLLDEELQLFLKAYFSRTRVEQVAQPSPQHEDIPDPEPPDDVDQRARTPKGEIDDDEIPF